MKYTLLIFSLILSCFFSASAMAETNLSTPTSFISVDGISPFSFETMRRCASDDGCRPGVESCIGGICHLNRERPPRCHTDRECTPLKCVAARCQ